MKIEKAVKVLSGKCRFTNPEHNEAIRLGIRALKRIQDARDIEPKSPCADLLPGETKE